MKVSIITLQVVKNLFSNYLIITGSAQPVNESNYFGVYVIKACTIASEKVGNLVLLNHSTDGLSRDAIWNIHTIMKYLKGRINHISFPDTNHNVKP